MEHKVQVLVGLDIDHQVATLDITGCLTKHSVPALFPLIRRAGAMIDSPRIEVVLNHARHIDQTGLDRLKEFAADPTHPGYGHTISITTPAALPPCPTQHTSAPAETVAA